jgi:hypothetical protein
MTLRASVSDIFYTRKTIGIIGDLNQTEAGWVNKGDSRALTLSFSYQFGKAVTNSRRHQSSGAEDEKNRVKG